MKHTLIRHLCSVKSACWGVLSRVIVQLDNSAHQLRDRHEDKSCVRLLLTPPTSDSTSYSGLPSQYTSSSPNHVTLKRLILSPCQTDICSQGTSTTVLLDLLRHTFEQHTSHKYNSTQFYGAEPGFTSPHPPDLRERITFLQLQRCSLILSSLCHVDIGLTFRQSSAPQRQNVNCEHSSPLLLLLTILTPTVFRTLKAHTGP